MQSNLQATIIISTFNKPEWLKLVLFSFDIQTTKKFEIIVADDGSDEKTKAVIDQFSEHSDLKVIHVWQEDDGFQKTKILNKAMLASNTDYLIFTDGDCIARKDFVQTHLDLRKLKYALSGGYFKLTDDVSKKINTQVISDQKCYEKDWLIAEGQPATFKMNKLTKSKIKSKFLNVITPTKATFDGMNVSCWKSDILAVNGFDERMKYGGEDREVGERMMNNGIRFLQIRYSAICVHLHHDRPYENEDTTRLNKQIRKATKREKRTYTKHGIQKM
ncbi:glycosyltransferase family 2 protein [Winogradskyella psychrotolerans]|uniref:glycosyltransferase family 2 protein n=1 Tax=Winogradskyella psychrotolerans TaxID=1344585 RepID=UPI001C06DC57|nr:glycosyltransferase family 2 protein [Winogradskyella psychrotolerans]MBU2928975.1 glycosyltransferase family 2 protein [Winogradskyella psychrotolerans]